jgi:hypothetical protein
MSANSEAVKEEWLKSLRLEELASFCYLPVRLEAETGRALRTMGLCVYLELSLLLCNKKEGFWYKPNILQ